MLVGRCSSQLSGHQNDQRNQKVTTSERSASRISCLTEGLQRVVEEPVLSEAEGTPRMLVARCSSRLSGHQNEERNQKVTTSESHAEGRKVAERLNQSLLM
jgi:hypothetical protein